jgi:hypothetical protein
LVQVDLSEKLNSVQNSYTVKEIIAYIGILAIEEE